MRFNNLLINYAAHPYAYPSQRLIFFIFPFSVITLNDLAARIVVVVDAMKLAAIHQFFFINASKVAVAFQSM